jgi:hypothetical protein
VVANRLRDLQRRKHQPARRMEDEVKRHVVVRHLDGAENVFGIIDVDVAHYRKAEQPHRLLPVHEQDHARVSLTFELRDLARAHGLQHALSQHRLDRGEHEEQPKKIAD